MEEVEQEQRAPEAKVLNKLNTFQQDEISSAIKRRNQFYSLQDDWTKRRDETQKKNTTENCEPDNISSAIKRRNQFNRLDETETIVEVSGKGCNTKKKKLSLTWTEHINGQQHS